MHRRSLLTLAAAAAASPAPARAEAAQVRLSHGYGILYLPLMVMRDRKLLEAAMEAAGLPRAEVTWQVVDGGNVINDAMLAGALDIAGTGAPGFITLWAKARGIPRAEVVGLCGLSTCALSLNTNRPGIKTLADFTPADKIAIPGIKTSLAAVVLQMLVAQKFGQAEYSRLDPMTVGLAHPEAYGALMSGKTEIAAHFASPPYSILELQDPRIHRVIAASEVLGEATLDVVYAPRRFVDANPGITGAFLQAMDTACTAIAADPAAAADSFIRLSAARMKPDDVLAMVRDPDTRFSATPTGVMRYAEFMHAVGSIKAAPARWTDMFVPALAGRAGS